MYVAIWVQSDDGMQCVEEFEHDDSASLAEVKASITAMLHTAGHRLTEATEAEPTE